MSERVESVLNFQAFSVILNNWKCLCHWNKLLTAVLGQRFFSFWQLGETALGEVGVVGTLPDGILLKLFVSSFSMLYVVLVINNHLRSFWTLCIHMKAKYLCAEALLWLSHSRLDFVTGIRCGLWFPKIARNRFKWPFISVNLVQISIPVLCGAILFHAQIRSFRYGIFANFSIQEVAATNSNQRISQIFFLCSQFMVVNWVLENVLSA